jgi:small subunit ribosomal protein S1
VLNIDVANERLSLGIKQLEADPWSEIPVRYRPGTRVKGKVTSITDFGVFLELEEGIEGLVHVSELSQEKVANPREFTTIDAELDAVVLNVDTVERKIGLSIKSLQSAMEKAEIAEYLGSQGQATSNLGELLKDLKKNDE